MLVGLPHVTVPTSLLSVAVEGSRAAVVVADNAGTGPTVFTTTTRTNARTKISPSIGIAFSILRVFLELPSSEFLILFPLH